MNKGSFISLLEFKVFLSIGKSLQSLDSDRS